MTNIHIKQVIIKNFMGIKSTTLHIPKTGVIQVLGKNRDSKLLTSNGTGKTTVFLAILQGLFNKVPDMDLTSINNLVTRKPYYIEIVVKVDDDEYVVINDRDSLQITVLKNKVMVATKIRESLRYIEYEILGVSYNEFLLLTRVTSNSIKSLFEVTSSNLLLRLFNLHELDTYEAKLKKAKTQLNAELRVVSRNINKSNLPNVDVNALTQENNKLTGEISTLSSKHNTLQLQETDLYNKQIELQDSLDMMGGVCKTCGQSLPIPLDTSKSVEDLSDELNVIHTQLSDVRREMNTLLVQMSDKREEVKRNSTRILVAQEFMVHDLDKLREEQVSIKSQIKDIEEALHIITHGDVHYHFLSRFINLLNQLLINSETEHQIVAYIDKTSISYKLKTDGVPKSISQLSGGESTVIGLTILSAIFTTISKLVGKNINLLVFDEAIHATDNVSESIIANIIKSMKSKSLFVIQHHNEIPTSVFNDTLYIEKLNKEVKIVNGF